MTGHTLPVILCWALRTKIAAGAQATFAQRDWAWPLAYTEHIPHTRNLHRVRVHRRIRIQRQIRVLHLAARRRRFLQRRLKRRPRSTRHRRRCSSRNLPLTYPRRVAARRPATNQFFHRVWCKNTTLRVPHPPTRISWPGLSAMKGPPRVSFFELGSPVSCDDWRFGLPCRC